MNILWFLLACFFLFIEIGSPGLLYFLALCAGAGVAFVASCFGFSLENQLVAFFMASIVSIGFVSFFVRYIGVVNKGSHRSNTDLLLGKVVTVIELQSLTSGQGRLGGETWLIKLQGDGELQVGMKVSVVGVQGCHLQVRIFIHNQ